MRTIQPISIWSNGINHQVSKFKLTSINDDLSTSATFYYQLFDDNDVQIASGNVIIDGIDYNGWGTTGNINDEAYEICSNKLSLVLIS